MTRASAAAATGLPISPSVFDPLPRRGFLRGLATLPLIGGSVALLGAPSAVAEPVTDEMMWVYKEWLHYEHRMLSYELAGHDRALAEKVDRYFKGCPHWHFQWSQEGMRGPAGWIDAPQPSTRAALVLASVGCDWRDHS